ncbi:hypothetical protein JAAARDRAFT_39497 [Jaapia argillacea MUCL 33604]|uniref:Protoheme IX farnesyltransferase, mitochondrial n=1 Tax=Jaapia argillacea MUCL 33604 TaxID=933084 RepID=A0A067PS17_9AGAM|nr:hypothetical protein JAAARDRAFT_39497 [Jaapia argillacea MUCL 33604]
MPSRFPALAAKLWTSTRLTSSLARPAAFTSFFFHNTQWSSSPSSPSRPQTSWAPSPYPPPTIPLSTYKPTQTSPSLLRTLSLYSELSKTRLTILNVLTAMSGVALSPLPTTVPVLLATALGTALCSASANTMNQIQEIPYDAQMARTRNRPLVRRAITPLHATGFAIATGIAGPAILWTMVNPTTAVLGVANVVLYAWVYTYLKRKSITNTWVGAVVGAIPPVMGWTACGGQLLPSASYPIALFIPKFLIDFVPSLSSLPIPDLAAIDNPLGPLALFLLLFSWQFPHFNSLSHLIRSSYAQAGYHMLSVVSPPHNALVSLRHALLMIPFCSILIPLSGLTTWAFALTSLVPNLMCTRAAWAFWRCAGNGEKEARKVWHACLWYLPVILGLMMVHKNGMDWSEWIGLKKKTVVEGSLPVKGDENHVTPA